MYNLLIAIAAGIAAFLAFLAIPLFTWWSALLPATVALLGAYYVLARRTLKQLEAILLASQKDLVARRTEACVEKLGEGFKLSRWQFLVAGQVHAQLGMILYMMKRFDDARPHLEKSYGRIGQARAMLGALHYMKKDWAAMEKTFEAAVSLNKKDGFLWGVYAWCLDNAGERDKALKALARAVDASPSDEKLKANRLALQNEKRLKMKAYGNEWWIFHLERPPADIAQAMSPSLQKKGYRGYKGP